MQKLQLYGIKGIKLDEYIWQINRVQWASIYSPH